MARKIYAMLNILEIYHHMNSRLFGGSRKQAQKWSLSAEALWTALTAVCSEGGVRAGNF